MQNTFLNLHKREIDEDFDFIKLENRTDTYDIFSKMIREKYFRRMKNECFKEAEEKTFKNFVVIDDQTDTFHQYKNNYREIKEFYLYLERNLIQKLEDGIRQSFSENVNNFKNSLINRSKYSTEIESMIEEFKLQIEILKDFSTKGKLYKFLDEENCKRFFNFNIKYSKIQDIMIPFFLSKLFGSFNTISTKMIHKVFIALLSRIMKINISTWALFLPDIEFAKLNNWFGQNFERFLFSKLFKKQKSQLKFLFTNLNQLIREHINEIDKRIIALYQSDIPLIFSEYQLVIENINLKYSELNSLKFPKKKNQVLNINQICQMTDFNYKKELVKYKEELDFLEKNKDIKTFDIRSFKSKSCDNRGSKISIKDIENFSLDPKKNSETQILNFNPPQIIQRNMEQKQIDTFSIKKFKIQDRFLKSLNEFAKDELLD